MLDLELWDLEETKADKRKLVKYRCPCSMCAGGKVLSRTTIRKHLRRYKRDSAFTKFVLVSKIYSHFFNYIELYTKQLNYDITLIPFV